MANNYESEITQFLKNLKEQRPALEAEQREGRGRLWDKTLNAELEDGFRDSRVQQRPYVYQTES
jgi:hypothetical protein